MSETVETPHYTGVKMMDPTSTAGPIGLLAFGIATVLLSLVNAGYYPLDSMIVMMGTYVGLAMAITGYMEWRKGNSFGAAAFATFGFFWLSFVGLLLLPKLGLAAAPSSTAMAAYLFMWALFAFVTFLATLKYNRALQFIFATVTILFVLLGLGYLTGNTLFTTIGGYEGIICGLSAVYTGFGQVLNEVYERTVVPL
ncbi:MAG: acetate uptake transporter [Methanospirillum sp.]